MGGEGGQWSIDPVKISTRRSLEDLQTECMKYGQDMVEHFLSSSGRNRLPEHMEGL